MELTFLACSTAVLLALAGATLVHQLVWGDASAPATLVAETKSASRSPRLVRFLRTQRHFLVGFALMSLGDWLQGPYLFSMYDSAGVSRAAQMDLYSFDFLLGAVLSVAVGVVSDLGGRRRSCAAYGVLYGLSCLCNHFPQWFSVLALGCAVDGLCNALLRCAFESYWAVAAKQALAQRRDDGDEIVVAKSAADGKKKAGGADRKEKEALRAQEERDESWINYTLALSQWAGTVCSLVAGLLCYGCVHAVGEYFAVSKSDGAGSGADSSGSSFNVDNFKYTATMDLAALVLFAGSAYVTLFWEADGDGAATEKKAADAQSRGFVSVLWEALTSLPVRSLSGASIFVLELCAEAALLVFVCLYPSLLHAVFAATGNAAGSSDSAAPFGVIFTQLMAALAVGSYWYSLAAASAASAAAAAGGTAASSPIQFTMRALTLASLGVAAAVLVLFAVARSNPTELVALLGSVTPMVDGGALLRCVVLVAMWAFEVAVGVYLSALGAVHEHATSSDDVRASAVGICRMLSYVVAWCAVSLYKAVDFAAPPSPSAASVAAREEVYAWGVCCAVSVVFAVAALVARSALVSEEETEKEKRD